MEIGYDWNALDWRTHERAEWDWFHAESRSHGRRLLLIIGPEVGLEARSPLLRGEANRPWCSVELRWLVRLVRYWSRPCSCLQLSCSVSEVRRRRNLHPHMVPRALKCSRRLHSRSMEHARSPSEVSQNSDWRIWITWEDRHIVLSSADTLLKVHLSRSRQEDQEKVFRLAIVEDAQCRSLEESRGCWQEKI